VTRMRCYTVLVAARRDNCGPAVTKRRGLGRDSDITRYAAANRL
jgi:hypothetical protein